MNGLFDWANAVAFHAFGQTVKWSDLIGNILALATVGFALRRSIWTWPVQIAGCVLLFGANMGAHLGGSAARQVALAAAAVYGWVRWSSARKGDSGVTVRWASWTERGLVAVALAAGTAAFAELLTATHSSWAPWPDAYIFIGSLVATAAQARGLVEFWFVWVAVDVVGVPLAFDNGLPVSGMVYGVFFVMVVAGTRQWIIRARTASEHSATPNAIPTALPARATKEVVNAMTGISELEDAQTALRASAHPGEIVLDSIEYAVAQLAAGRPVVVVDDEDRENEGDLIFAASLATPEVLAFTVRYSSGVVCVPMPGDDLDRLSLPPMTAINQDRKGTAYAVSVDARDGVSTGISAADRARTIRLLADPATGPDDLTRPGHVFPLRAQPGGVLVRPGHTEAAVDLCRLADLPLAGGIAEIVNDDGSMARLPELAVFAKEHGLALISIADLIAYRRRTERTVEKAAEVRLPTAFGEFTAVGYRSTVDGGEHIALVRGDIGDGRDVLVRVHSECLTGDIFGSLRCDCGPQLHAALRAVDEEGRGVVLYVRGHEGRGIGLMHKLQAYQLQERGHDTVDANLELGLPADARDYGTGAQILADLGVRSMRLMTNNPDKRSALEGFGLEVSGRVPLPVHVTEDNIRYLRTKRDRMGHDLPGLDPVDEVVDGVTAAAAAAAGPSRAAESVTPDLDALLASIGS